MSLTLVRQALAFVDEEESVGKRGKRAASNRAGSTCQDHKHLYKKKVKKGKEQSKSKEVVAEENIRKLLALSERVAVGGAAGKIVERAIKGKPLVEKVEVKLDEDKSILFSEEETKSLKKLEEELFCK